ncbi:choline transporter-like protein 4 isoform X3 [Folsomia candida]|uniref:choline transporter-like protein 4 isoform X3 n=1 Tax=Folsomia candida TaxID=158441 RepID=UPI000B8F584C|nr:choline transporter-like protein 4 isoform X3 [Folsomia candida]
MGCCTGGSEVADINGHPREFDEKFHGPIEKRSCTDVTCLLMLVAFIIGWCVIAVIGFNHGDPTILVYPTDSYGQKCGVDEAVKDKPYLFFFDITRCAKANVLTDGCRTPQVCVKECPDPNDGQPWSVKMEIAKKTTENDIKQKLICKYDVDKSTQTVAELIALPKQQCAKFIIPSKTQQSTITTRNISDSSWKWKAPVKTVKSALVRRCIPSLANIEKFSDEEDVEKANMKKGVANLIEFFNTKENLELLFQDLKASWVVILGCLVVGAVVAGLWICLMRCFAGIMVWFSLFGMIGVLGFSCYYSVDKYIELKSVNETIEFRREANTDVLISEEEFNSQLETYLKLKNTWLAFAIITGTLLGILLLIVIFLRSRLYLAVALIKQGARAVSEMSFTIFWPIVPWFWQVLVIGWFLLVGVYLATATEEVYLVNGNCTCSDTQRFIENERCYIKSFTKALESCLPCKDISTCTYQNHQKLSQAFYFHLYNIFGVIWLLCFVNDLGDMVLAGSFAGWYWTFNRKKDLALFPVASSFFRTVRYHLGTVAFGSLIISIIKFIRYFLEYVDAKTRQYQDNPAAKAVLWCMKCCFWCLEKFMKFINRNAYIMVAVYGKNFCVSARDSFFLVMRNALRAFVLDKVTDFLLFLGKLVVTGIVAIGSFYIFTHRFPDSVNENIPELNFYLVPVIIITIGVYCIASVFFSVYEMAVDTLFLCFLEDCERNDGSPEKPYYMPKELMLILGKQNKKLEQNGAK